MYLGDSLEVETSVNSFGIGNPGSLRGCQRQSQTGAMYSGGSLEVETSLKSFGTVDPGSLRGCQRQSQTDAMYTGGSLEVEANLKSFGTRDPGSLRGCQRSFVPIFHSRVTGYLSSLMDGIPQRIMSLSPF